MSPPRYVRRHPRPTHRNPPATQATQPTTPEVGKICQDAQLMARTWMWENGAVVCDKWLRSNNCQRENCPHEHRSPHPGETVPLCYDFFVKKDRCEYGVQCLLSHDEKSLSRRTPGVPPSSDEPPRGPSSTTSSPVAASRPLKRTPGGGVLLEGGDDQRDRSIPNRRPNTGLTTSKPHVHEETSSYQTRRRPRQRKMTSDHMTIQGLSQNAKAEMRNGSSFGAFQRNGATELQFAGAPAVPSRTADPDPREARPTPGRNSTGTSCSAGSPDSISSGGVPLNINPQNSDNECTINAKPVPIIKSLKIAPEVDVLPHTQNIPPHRRGLPPPPRQTSPTPPTRHVRTRGLVKKEEEPTLWDIPVIKDDTFGLQFDQVEKAIWMKDHPALDHANAITYLNDAWELRQREHEPSVEDSEVIEVDLCLSDSESSDWASLWEVPEWDLERCFNCFKERHSLDRCPDRTLRHMRSREDLRDSLGVISRKWTEKVVLRHPLQFDEGVVLKHEGIRRVWTPYVSESGKHITPMPRDQTTTVEQSATRLSIFGPDPTPTPDVSQAQVDRLYLDEPATEQEQEVTAGETSPETQVTNERGSPESMGNDSQTALVLLAPPIPITGKNHQHCAVCGSVHSSVAPCSTAIPDAIETNNWDEALQSLLAARQKYDDDAKTDKDGGDSDDDDDDDVVVSESSSATDEDSQVLTKFHRTRQNPTLATSQFPQKVEVCTYRITNDRTESFFHRGDLALLRRIERTVRNAVRIKSDSNKKRRGFRKLPNEIIEAICRYAASDFPADLFIPVKDMEAGRDFKANAMVNIERAENLRGVAKSCRLLRFNAQLVIYQTVQIEDYTALERFARSVTLNPQLGGIVRALRIDLAQTQDSWQNYGVTRYKVTRNGQASFKDFASLLVRVMEACQNIQVLTCNMFGAILGFSAVQRAPLGLREICLTDPASTGQVVPYLWAQLREFPNLRKFKIVHSEMNGCQNFKPLEIPKHMVIPAFRHGFSTLNCLTLERSPEVSDKSLISAIPILQCLNKLAIIECKLVTSLAIGHVVRKLPNLSVLIFWVWQDHRGQTTSMEADCKEHLCDTLAKYGGGLGVINLRPHRICEKLWDGLPYARLHRLLIRMNSFRHCCEKNPGDEISFEKSYKKARADEILPALPEDRCFLGLNYMNIIYT